MADKRKKPKPKRANGLLGEIENELRRRIKKATRNKNNNRKKKK